MNPKKLGVVLLSITYSNSAMHIEWGWQEFSVDSEGNAKFTKGMMMTLEKTYNFRVSRAQLVRLYKTINQAGFFSMNNDYTDPTIMDGGTSAITVTANGTGKTVSVTNYYLPEFDVIASEIIAIIQSELGGNCFSFDDMKGNCDIKKAECAGKDIIECADWDDFCEWEEGSLEITPEFCTAVENREICVEYCAENQCNEDLCDELMFEADGCVECTAGCCSFCSDLDSCAGKDSCRIVWIHPSGESWQFAGCENRNYCEGLEGLCNHLSLSYQGYRYASLIEGDGENATEYSGMADELQDLYNEECE